jgi:molybdenum cofactor synthesis domain-containing protein
MISLDEAVAEVTAACRSLPARSVAVDEALGLVLAETVIASEPVPPFANSAMDGFAVRSSDVAEASPQRPSRLRVVGTVAAGHAPAVSVGPGEAVRIMTGALVPEGADAVAIVETTTCEGDDVLVAAPAVPGGHIRQAGEDVDVGAEVFAAGTSLGPGHIGVLCSIGREEITAVPVPVVGVLSTGDELVVGGGRLQPGQIRESNRRTMMALLSRDRYLVVDLGVAPDDDGEIERRLREGCSRCDAVLTTGGVSMGDFDYVKAVLDRIGKMHWMQVAVRPSKPFAFGTVGSVPVFGLPGNPVSSMVSYEILARPGLRKLSGRDGGDLFRPVIRGVAEVPLQGARDERITFVRVQAGFAEDGRLHVRAAGGQGSHQLHAMSLSNGLAVVGPGARIEPGGEVDVLPLDH